MAWGCPGVSGEGTDGEDAWRVESEPEIGADATEGAGLKGRAGVTGEAERTGPVLAGAVVGLRARYDGSHLLRWWKKLRPLDETCFRHEGHSRQPACFFRSTSLRRAPPGLTLPIKRNEYPKPLERVATESGGRGGEQKFMYRHAV